MAGQRRSSSGIDVDSAAFLSGLTRAVEALELRSERDLARVGLRVQNAARSFCPVDTGRLRSSIQYVPGRDALGPFFDVGTNVEYAPFVEYGTSRTRAQPFLRPALAQAVGYVAEEVGA